MWTRECATLCAKPLASLHTRLPALHVAAAREEIAWSSQGRANSWREGVARRAAMGKKRRQQAAEPPPAPDLEALRAHWTAKPLITAASALGDPPQTPR